MLTKSDYFCIITCENYQGICPIWRPYCFPLYICAIDCKLIFYVKVHIIMLLWQNFYVSLFIMANTLKEMYIGQ